MQLLIGLKRITNSMFSPFLPSLVLKARHLGGSAFCNFYRLGVSEQALGGIPLGSGIVVEAKPSELSCIVYYSTHVTIKTGERLIIPTF